MRCRWIFDSERGDMGFRERCGCGAGVGCGGRYILERTTKDIHRDTHMAATLPVASHGPMPHIVQCTEPPTVQQPPTTTYNLHIAPN